MRRCRRRKAKINTKPTTRKKTVYSINGITYSSKGLVEFHRLLEGNPLVTSFHLPTVKDEQTIKTGKFKAKQCDINGVHFDSLMEARYYIFLLEQKKFGFIKDFDMQVEYVLMKGYKNKHTGKAVRKISYIADFVVTKSDDSIEVIDVKGEETDVFKIKAKLFGYTYPDLKLTCYRWSEKFGHRWIELEELKKLNKKKG